MHLNPSEAYWQGAFLPDLVICQIQRCEKSAIRGMECHDLFGDWTFVEGAPCRSQSSPAVSRASCLGSDHNIESVCEIALDENISYFRSYPTRKKNISC